MRLFFHKISLIISSILSVILISIPTTPVVDNMNNNIKDNNAIQEKVINENEIIKSDQEELQVEEKEIKEVVEEKKPNIENNESTTSNTSITKSTNKEIDINSKQESNNTQSNATSSPSANTNVEVHEEVPKQETNNVNQYIGVANPNDFYYSFHHGKIEYSNMDSCLADVPRISFKDTIDIINAWCIDVVDGQGTILGQYLYINCSSGNCDKYK
ncbi:MAG: hypothetical protein SPF04_03005 [Bacilli bacterium]|nr:hypothetical protein [Bacilli bacterium]